MPSSFPSFVEQAPATAHCRIEVISHWSPERSGVEAVDSRRAGQYFREALVFARALTSNGRDGSYFLTCVLKEIRCSPIGTIERAFLDELASKAACGGNSPVLSEQEGRMFGVRYGVDVPAIREIERVLRDFLISAGQQRRPDLVHCLLNDWLHSPDPDGWVIELAALAICGAAMKGEAN